MRTWQQKLVPNYYIHVIHYYFGNVTNWLPTKDKRLVCCSNKYIQISDLTRTCAGRKTNAKKKKCKKNSKRKLIKYRNRKVIFIFFYNLFFSINIFRLLALPSSFPSLVRGSSCRPPTTSTNKGLPIKQRWIINTSWKFLHTNRGQLKTYRFR
jgi:hypothetical protein